MNELEGTRKFLASIPETGIVHLNKALEWLSL